MPGRRANADPPIGRLRPDPLPRASKVDRYALGALIPDVHQALTPAERVGRDETAVGVCGDDAAAFSGWLFTHNLEFSFLVFAADVTYGLGTVALLFYHRVRELVARRSGRRAVASVHFAETSRDVIQRVPVAQILPTRGHYGAEAHASGESIRVGSTTRGVRVCTSFAT